MKNLIVIAFLLISGVISAQESDTFSGRELIMMAEINEMRANPKSYVSKVEGYILMCEKKLNMIEGGKLKTTTDYNSHISAANELIIVLTKIDPIGKLTPNISMYPVTKSHGEYLKTNNSGHFGPNGKLAPARMSDVDVGSVTENIVTDNGLISPTILLLLVDAGIESRGHRNNLLNPDSKYISVYTNGDSWVMNFAN